MLSRAICCVTIGGKPGLAHDCRLWGQRFPVEVGDPVDPGCIKLLAMPSQRHGVRFRGWLTASSSWSWGVDEFCEFTPAAMCKVCLHIASLMSEARDRATWRSGVCLFGRVEALISRAFSKVEEATESLIGCTTPNVGSWQGLLSLNRANSHSLHFVNSNTYTSTYTPGTGMSATRRHLGRLRVVLWRCRAGICRP